MAKRDSYEDDDDFLDEEIADWDDDEELSGDSEAAEADDSDADDEADADDEPLDEDAAESPVAENADDDEADEADEAAEPEPVEEEIVYPPDDDKALAALKKLRVRLDTTDKGNVWRAILDDTNGRDPTLVLLKGLPALREVWLLGTKITAPAAESFREEHPKIRVFF